MSNNTLIAICVGAMFLLAVVVVAGSFADRRHMRELIATLIERQRYDYKVIPETTAVIPDATTAAVSWPAVPKE